MCCAPARQLGHEHSVDLPRLCERHNVAPLRAVELHPGAGFLERADHLVAGTGGKGGQIPFLARAGLVGGRNPAIEGGALSQLNSPGGRPASRCSGSGASRSNQTLPQLGQPAMPRRRALTEAQFENLFAFPVTEADLMRHWTLAQTDLAAVERRRNASTNSALRCSFVPSATLAGCCGRATPSPNQRCVSSPSNSTSAPARWPPTLPVPRPDASSWMAYAKRSASGCSRRDMGANSLPGCCRWRSPPPTHPRLPKC